jgi:protein-tyrosine phosphatase
MTPHFEEAGKFINEALKNGNILVHCAAGISRVI